MEIYVVPHFHVPKSEVNLFERLLKRPGPSPGSRYNQVLRYTYGLHEKKTQGQGRDKRTHRFTHTCIYIRFYVCDTRCRRTSFIKKFPSFIPYQFKFTPIFIFGSEPCRDTDQLLMQDGF